VKLLHREVYNGSPREKRNGKEKPAKRKVVEITLNIHKQFLLWKCYHQNFFIFW